MTEADNNVPARNVLTLAQVQELSANRQKCIMIIDNRVYDVTKFMDEVRQEWILRLS